MLRKIFYAVTIGVVVIFVISFIISSIQTERYLSEVERVVVIYLEGPIEESVPGFSLSGITPRSVSQKLNRAEDDDSIKAAVIRINSSGGAVAASQQIKTLIKSFSKPLVVSMGDIAASGGYYISVPADGIVAHPGTMTGSIGVISNIVNLEGLYEKLGLEVETIKTGEHKDMYQRSLTEKEKELLQDISDEAYEQFITDVAENRGMEIDRVRDFADGQLYLGTQALNLGLVDKLGGIEEAIEFAAEIADLDEPVRHEFPSPGFFDRMRDFTFQISAVIHSFVLPEEVLIKEWFRSRDFPGLRYEIH